MGYTRLSQTIQERKLGLIDRAMRSDDDQTRWAVEMVVARGTGESRGARAVAAEAPTEGLWITSLQEYGIMGGGSSGKR